MSIQSTGFAAMTEKGLDIRTAAHDELTAKLATLHFRGVDVVCNKEGCDCVDRAMSDYADDVQIVPVKVSAITHS